MDMRGAYHRTSVTVTDADKWIDTGRKQWVDETSNGRGGLVAAKNTYVRQTLAPPLSSLLGSILTVGDRANPEWLKRCIDVGVWRSVWDQQQSVQFRQLHVVINRIEERLPECRAPLPGMYAILAAFPCVVISCHVFSLDLQCRGEYSSFIRQKGTAFNALAVQFLSYSPNPNHSSRRSLRENDVESLEERFTVSDLSISPIERKARGPNVIQEEHRENTLSIMLSSNKTLPISLR
ncbi:hypothetical protein EV421DRAFT_1926414 [Armillaria borealis]|uniref:Uncharacterized protein n=1 Tax=Armillaria borealis TaxID=47425 RepID=A0AA39MUZ7_9AGAR|nr:hypothetical protein EV421DRAFT_1926414 [Armillaria borealis]